MIFVTVGSQLAFDRLIKAVDEWAAENKAQEIYAQIGISNYQPKNFEFCQTMTPDQYIECLSKADFVVAHAGMGTIISALEFGKVLLLLPRLACNGEHRNDHQLATATRLSHFGNISVADNEAELLVAMSDLVRQGTSLEKKIQTEVSVDLIKAIKRFVNED